MRVLLAVLVVGVLVGACMAAPSPPAALAPSNAPVASVAPPVADASVAPAPSASAAASAASTMTQAEYLEATKCQGRPCPPYKAGDFRLFYPSGALTIGTPATEDGGAGSVVRYHDGQENVCMQGCVSLARTAVQTAAQSRSGTFTDEAGWEQDVLACIRRVCLDKKGTTWPPESK